MSGRKTKLSRREFLEASAAGAASVSVPGLAGCPDPDDPYADAPASVAFVAEGASTLAAVRRAVELAGGLDEIQPGETVFIKPNAVGVIPDARAFVTRNDVLAAVIELVRERDPGHIVVGDRSARLFSSSIVFDETGMEAVALAAGADEVYPAPRPADDPDAWLLLQPPAWDETWAEAGGVLTMRRVVDADHLINVPVCKNHRWAIFSLSMKNLIGIVGDDSRDVMHYNQDSADRLSRDIAILNQTVEPLITVIDADAAIVNGGPEGAYADGVITEPGLILAGKDRVALDAAGVALLQHELASVEVPSPDAMYWRLATDRPWDLPQITNAIELGLGVASSEDVRLAFEGVEEALAAAIEERFRA